MFTGTKLIIREASTTPDNIVPNESLLSIVKSAKLEMPTFPDLRTHLFSLLDCQITYILTLSEDIREYLLDMPYTAPNLHMVR